MCGSTYRQRPKHCKHTTEEHPYRAIGLWIAVRRHWDLVSRAVIFLLFLLILFLVQERRGGCLLLRVHVLMRRPLTLRQVPVLAERLVKQKKNVHMKNTKTRQYNHQGLLPASLVAPPAGSYGSANPNAAPSPLTRAFVDHTTCTAKGMHRTDCTQSASPAPSAA